MTNSSETSAGLVERLSEAFGEPIHIAPDDFLEKVIAGVFCRQPDMSGDQRKRLMFRELHAVQDVAAAIMKALTAAEAENARLKAGLEEIRDRDWVENALDPQWAAHIARATLEGDRG